MIRQTCKYPKPKLPAVTAESSGEKVRKSIDIGFYDLTSAHFGGGRSRHSSLLIIALAAQSSASTLLERNDDYRLLFLPVTFPKGLCLPCLD